MKNVLQGTLFMLVAALGVLRMELAADEKLPLNATQGSDVTGVVRETDAGPSPGDGVNDPKIAVEPPVSGPHDAGPSPVAVADSDEAYVDTKRLFSEDPQFLDGRKKLDKAVAEIEEQMKASAEEISQHQSKLSKLKSDPSADRDEISALEKLATELEARLAVDQKVIRRKIIREEAELYGVTYDRIRSAIADYARKNGIRIVRRKQAIFSEPLTEQPTNAQEILARVNQDILFNADEPRDITEPVLELLKKQAEQAE